MGGAKGYVSGMLMSSVYVPPAYGVSGGPGISPDRWLRLPLLTRASLIFTYTRPATHRRVGKARVFVAARKRDHPVRKGNAQRTLTQTTAGRLAG